MYVFENKNFIFNIIFSEFILAIIEILVYKSRRLQMDYNNRTEHYEIFFCKPSLRIIFYICYSFNHHKVAPFSKEIANQMAEHMRRKTYSCIKGVILLNRQILYICCFLFKVGIVI